MDSNGVSLFNMTADSYLGNPAINGESVSLTTGRIGTILGVSNYDATGWLRFDAVIDFRSTPATVDLTVTDTTNDDAVVYSSKTTTNAENIATIYGSIGRSNGAFAFDDIVIEELDESEMPQTNSYTISYIVDGRTSSEVVDENAYPTDVPSAEKTGYIFKGWQVGDDTGNIISTETLESTPVTASVTYTAVFEEDPNYIEEMASVEFSTLPSGYMLVAGPDSETAASNLIDVEITGELGTDLAANPDPRVEDFDVTYEIKGFNWKSNEQAPTADSAEWGYCDTYGRVVETSETGIDFQIKNHVFNYYGQVVATVTYNEKTQSISAPLAFIGDSAANTNNLQILPRGGYYEDFDAYSPDMVGYEAATSSNNSSATDVVTDNWASYGSNGARSVKIAEEEGNRFMRLEVTENAGNSAFAVNQIDAVTDSQIVIDQMVRFYAAESEIMLKTANPVTWNNDATTFSLKFTGSAVTLNGVDMQATVTTGEWYRILVTSDVTSGKCYAEIYSESGELLGASEVVNFVNAGSTNPTYYMFRTPDRTVTMIDFDKVKITRAVIDAETLNTTTTNQTIAIPEAGQEAVTETVTVSANTTDGLPAIGLATWSIGDAMIDGVTVTPSAEDSHVATVTVEAGATPGNLPINVLIGGSMATINLTLSSTQDSVQFTDSSSSISIPLSEAQTVVQPYTAAVVDGDGNEIEGKEITYTLYEDVYKRQV